MLTSEGPRPGRVLVPRTTSWASWCPGTGVAAPAPSHGEGSNGLTPGAPPRSPSQPGHSPCVVLGGEQEVWLQAGVCLVLPPEGRGGLCVLGAGKEGRRESVCWSEDPGSEAWTPQGAWPGRGWDTQGRGRAHLARCRSSPACSTTRAPLRASRATSAPQQRHQQRRRGRSGSRAGRRRVLLAAATFRARPPSAARSLRWCPALCTWLRRPPAKALRRQSAQRKSVAGASAMPGLVDAAAPPDGRRKTRPGPPPGGRSPNCSAAARGAPCRPPADTGGAPPAEPSLPPPLSSSKVPRPAEGAPCPAPPHRAAVATRAAGPCWGRERAREGMPPRDKRRLRQGAVGGAALRSCSGHACHAPVGCPPLSPLCPVVTLGGDD